MAEHSTIHDCILLNLPKIQNRAGNISPIHGNDEIPFEIARVYYLYDIPGGESRGGHAHRELQQLIVAASGSFDITLDDGKDKKVISLNRPYIGLYLPTMIWRELSNFSSGGICLVLASHKYDEMDYYREYDDFLIQKRK